MLQVVLNAISGLVRLIVAPAAPPGAESRRHLDVAAVQTVLLAPILALVITFGEEYGWRGYLQSELLKLGRVRGVLLLA